MNWLMNLPGPVFLILLGVAVVAATWLWVEFDKWLDRRAQRRQELDDLARGVYWMHPDHADGRSDR